MLQQERHNQILAKLNLEGQVIVKELSQAFNVTEDCIRKDLTTLDVGGAAVTIYQLIKSQKFIKEVKEEFITGRYEEIIMGDESYLYK